MDRCSQISNDPPAAITFYQKVPFIIGRTEKMTLANGIDESKITGVVTLTPDYIQFTSLAGPTFPLVRVFKWPPSLKVSKKEETPNLIKYNYRPTGTMGDMGNYTLIEITGEVVNNDGMIRLLMTIQPKF
ncbi:MAG: hypothetical protein Hyperionvirus5_24 [Hyperionvirus sp.]|uniref:Uncharacterized protein n=1 Tax=Hyperionvirus sp. TaxID=2487770 RepID=A0A3G5A7R3_9VIRU|nr:MAG: hypothetical protein Hyperionvirus5_24 [Hyperionvirus sp.]